MRDMRIRRTFVPKISVLIGTPIIVFSKGKRYTSKVTSISNKNGMLEAKCGNFKFLCEGRAYEGVYLGQRI